MKLVITGPRSVGKSTVTPLVAQSLHLTYLESDQLMNEELADVGGLNAGIRTLSKEEIIKRGAVLIQHVFATQDNFVLDYPGGGYVARKDILPNDAIIIVLLPFSDQQQAIDFLYARERKRPHFDDYSDEDLYAKVQRNYISFLGVLTTEKICYVENNSVFEILQNILKLIPK